MLDIRQLTLTLGGRRLFDNLNLTIAADAKMALVGRNGVGKTTLLRVLAGEIHADDVSIAWPPHVTWGYLPQEVLRRGGETVIERVLGGAAHILALEREVELATTLLEAADAANATERANRLSDAQATFEQAGGPGLRPRAHEMLRGLGFSMAQIEGPLTALSGGWWMRVELARLLVGLPQYLFLDEPTNHLDESSMRWLANFLRRYAGAWLIVSHDRAFLNATTTSIAELTPQKIHVHQGNYDAFEKGRELRLADEAAQRDSYEQKVAHNMAFVERFGAKASKATQAQSRLKAIERLKPPPEDASSSERMRLRWPDVVRSGKRVLSAEGVSYGFGERKLFQAIDLEILRGEKIALIGPNGAGKSTLLNILAQRLAAQSGQIVLGHEVYPYHFAQHQLETLSADKTILATLREQSPTTSDEQLRRILGSFLFHGRAVFEQVGVLSGGEKSRVALARMMTCQINFLLLDEPTNHLDIDSQKTLREALEDFSGTLVIISHDETFLRPIVNQVWFCKGDGTIEKHTGGMDAFLARRAAAEQAVANQRQTRNESNDAPISGNKAQFLAQKEAQRQLSKAKRELLNIEQKIAATEARIATIDGRLADPSVFGQHDEAARLLKERAHLSEDELTELMERWETLMSQLSALDPSMNA